jgi:uncharacterized protein (DUF1800 family)
MAQSRPPLFRSILPVVASLFTLLPVGAIRAQETPSGALSDRDEIIHVLNRITFGPRPGDVEAVQKMGLHNYIEKQLHPETIDDSAVEQQLGGFDLLKMSSQELANLYLDEQKRQQQKKLEKQKLPAANDQPQAGPPMVNDPAQQTPPIQPQVRPQRNKAAVMNELQRNPIPTAIGELEQAKLVRAVGSERQLQEVLADFWNNHFNIDVKNKQCSIYKISDDRDVIRPHIWGKFRDLLEASAKSPAMLFYLNNATSTVARTVTPMEQQMTERVSAQMTQNGNAALVPPVPVVGQKRGGVNENYAREIMELHTLGVDGGYTQQDVQEVARCFTGWSVDRQTGAFAFHPRAHDNGAKVVLGHQIPAGGGMQDGETVLDILCSHPATAHHISLELCQRFVSDDPPAALVDRVAGVFTQTGGDLRQVTEAILTSPEFLSPSNYNNKIKSPLEFTVSAVRASESALTPQQPPPFDKIVPSLEGAGVMGRPQAMDRIERITGLKGQSLNWHILELGQPLFACTPPTGYKEVSKFWVSPGALIERLNFALALTQQELTDVRFDPEKILGGIDLDKPDAVLNQCVAVLLQNNITPSTRKVLEQTSLPAPGESKTVNPTKLIALIIGSPEFQRK